jgi:prepilin-type N-terminal cleavage/methylation domain-containing protein/prepilin-type processing-associated H-X9-DG protein
MHRCRGFTLIELLVVIAIIAILASILFPVFARAREQARKANCASNMRQIALAALSYAQDYDEILPLYSHGLGYAGSLGYAGDDGPRWADMMYPYIKNSQIFNCSSGTQRVAIFSGGSYLDIRTYSYGYVSASSGATEFGVGGRGLGEDGRSDDAADAESIGRIIPNAADTVETLGGRVNGMRHTGCKPSDYGAYAFNAAYADGHVKFVRLGDTYLAQWTIAED